MTVCLSKLHQSPFEITTLGDPFRVFLCGRCGETTYRPGPTLEEVPKTEWDDAVDGWNFW